LISKYSNKGCLGFIHINRNSVIVSVETQTYNNIKKLVYGIGVFFLIIVVFVLGLRVLLKNYSGQDKKVKIVRKYSKSFYGYDRVRGYSTKKNTQVRAECYINKKRIYNVLYTTNKEGIRIAPHDLAQIKFKPSVSSAIFFGCSFTFGEGLSDSQALPFIFEEKSKGRYKAYNFGCCGYGPHQMLASLEKGIIDASICRGGQTVVVYQALSSHIERAAFNYPYTLWDVGGPRYRLDKCGNVTGPRYTRVLFFASKIFNKLSLGNIFTYLARHQRSDYDRQLFVQIIKKAKEYVQDNYKGKFYIIYWEDNDSDTKQMIEKLKDQGLEVFTTGEIFGDNFKDKESFYVSKDGHPTHEACQLIAGYLLAKISIEPSKIKKEN